MKALSPHLLPLLLIAATFHLLPPSSAATAPAPALAPGSADLLRRVCNHTTKPEVCFSTYSPYANIFKEDMAILARISVNVSLPPLRQSTFSISSLSVEATGRTAFLLSNCTFHLGIATEKQNQSLVQFQQLEASASGKRGSELKTAVEAVATLMSHAISHETICRYNFEGELDSPVKEQVINLVIEAEKFTAFAWAFVSLYADGIKV